jgi:hypothetical protein
MNQSLILLDTGPLGMITNRSENAECKAAQAILFQVQGRETVIATTNVGHLSRFSVALTWQEIQ